jgi:hypothetical protein
MRTHSTGSRKCPAAEELRLAMTMDRVQWNDIYANSTPQLIAMQHSESRPEGVEREKGDGEKVEEGR